MYYLVDDLLVVGLRGLRGGRGRDVEVGVGAGERDGGVALNMET